MTKTIFISHANEDKARIAPFLGRMLKELPKEVELWIDRDEVPEIGGFEYDASRIKHIGLGKIYHAQIFDALSQVDMIVSFWTMNCLKLEKNILRGEIEYAATKKDLFVPIRLDKDAIYPLISIQDTSLYREADQERKFTNLLLRIRNDLNLAGNLSLDGLIPDKCGYLIDRARHVTHITAKYYEGANGIQNYVVPIKTGDAFSDLIWRICDFESARLVGAGKHGDDIRWHKISLPLDSVDISEFHERLEETYLANQAAAKLKDARQSNRTVCVYSEIEISNTDRSPGEYGRTWAKFMNKKFADAGAFPGAVGPYFLTVLGVHAKPTMRNWLRRLLVDNNDPYQCLMDDPSLRVPKPHALENINATHLGSWKNRPDIIELCRKNNVSAETLSNKAAALIAGKNTGDCTMQEFAERIATAWREAAN